MRQIEWERFNPDDPFPVYEPRSAATKRSKPKVPVITINRKSLLLSMLIWLLPFIQVDNLNVLPSAILIYSLGVCYLHELLVEIVEDLGLHDVERMKQDEEEYLKQQYDRALFELRVLQGRSNVRLIRRIENGVTNLYAID